MPRQMHMSEKSAEFALVFQGGDTFEFRLKRRKPFRLDTRFIHAGLIVIADLLLDRCPRRS